jgi:hypothetical protein
MVAEALNIHVLIELAPRKQELELSTTRFGTIFSRSLLYKISETVEFSVSYGSYIYILQGKLPELNRYTRGFPGKNEISPRVEKNAIQKVLFDGSQRPTDSQPIKDLESLSVFQQEGKRHIQKKKGLNCGSGLKTDESRAHKI